MSETPAEYNTKIIDEFRANQGRVGGMWQETALLLLRHTGAKSGKARVNTVAYLADDQRYLMRSRGRSPRLSALDQPRLGSSMRASSLRNSACRSTTCTPTRRSSEQ